MNRETVSVEQFTASLRGQGVPEEHLAFVCPMCGTVQSATDLIRAGAGATFADVEGFIAFSCVGRWTHRKPPPRTPGEQVGCNWTLGGLLNLHRYEVRTPDGKVHPRFRPATPDEARAHMQTQQPQQHEEKANQ